MSSFQDILNKPAAEIEAPKPLPVGTYLALVDGQPEFNKIGKNNTDCVEFKLKLAQAGDDVDQAILLEQLKGKPLSEKSIKHRLFITEDAVWRLKKFLVEDLGIEEGTRGLGEMIPEAMGKQVYVTLGHRPSDDGKQIYMEVKDTAKV